LRNELIKRDPREVKEHITLLVAASCDRKALISFAQGKQAESNDLDLLKGMPEIKYNSSQLKLYKSRGKTIYNLIANYNKRSRLRMLLNGKPHTYLQKARCGRKRR
jgi:hypothetical protein